MTPQDCLLSSEAWRGKKSTAMLSANVSVKKYNLQVALDNKNQGNNAKQQDSSSGGHEWMIRWFIFAEQYLFARNKRGINSVWWANIVLSKSESLWRHQCSWSPCRWDSKRTFDFVKIIICNYNIEETLSRHSEGLYLSSPPCAQRIPFSL